MTSNSYSWLIFLIFLTIGIFAQHLIYIQWDVAWLVTESQKFFAGGHYGREFFDPNPPMILYLYFPIVWLSQHTFLNTIQSIWAYTFFVGIVSWLISFKYVDLIFSGKNLEKTLLLAAIAFSYFILPVYEFAQREHFVVMLTTPYIFSAINLLTGIQYSVAPRWQVKRDRQGVRCLFSLIVGFLAGIGFAIKPFFLIIPLFIEIYLFFKGRNLKNLFRLENGMLLLTVLFYFLSIYLFSPEYYSFILPFVSHFYTGYATVSRWELFSAPVVLVCMVSLVLAMVTTYLVTVSDVIWILVIVTLSYLLFFFSSAQPWYYHIIPALSYSLMSLAIIFAMLLGSSAIRMILLAIWIMTIGVLFYNLYNDFRLFHQLKSSPSYVNTHLIQILKQNPAIKSLYAFSVYPGVSALPALYAPVKNCSRFTGFWMMPNINAQKPHALSAENYIKTAVTEDFQRCQPDLVIVDIKKNKNYFMGKSFDYIKFFSQDKRFANLWKNYCYQKTINDYYALYVRCPLTHQFSS